MGRPDQACVHVAVSESDAAEEKEEEEEEEEFWQNCSLSLHTKSTWTVTGTRVNCRTSSSALCFHGYGKNKMARHDSVAAVSSSPIQDLSPIQVFG